MNERIKEFIDKQQYPGWMMPEGEPERIPVILFDKEALAKFVEKVVKECAELTLDYKSDAYYNGWLDYRDEIKKHFGVEE